MKKQEMNRQDNPVQPANFVAGIPVFLFWFLLIILVAGIIYIYSNGKKVFHSTTNGEQRILSKEVSSNGEETVSPKYRFVKSVWARVDDLGKGDKQKKFLFWESLPVNAEISKDIEILSCEKEKGAEWPNKEKTNAWCSLIGKTYDAKTGVAIRRVVNKNDEIAIKDKNGKPTGEYYEGNKDLFALPEYSVLEGLQGFDDPDNKSKISDNGEYTLSIYPSVQEGMSKFMSDNNMVGTVFAYRPSNGDIYCMASTPGWTELEKITKRENPRKDILKYGAQRNGNFSVFAPGSTMKPITLLIFRDQEKFLIEEGEKPLKEQTINISIEDNDRLVDSHYAIDDTVLVGDHRKPKPHALAIHCTGNHSGNNSVYDGLGNSCNSFFAKLAEKLNFEKAKKTLEDMDFYVELYEKNSEETRKHISTIDNIRYNQSVFPFQKEMKKTKGNIENFIGEENLMVSPIDMAVLTALFGKLSADINSKVYFPRIWLPADKERRHEGFPELLLTGKSFTEKEQDKKTYIGNTEKKHIAKLSDFVSTRKEAIAEVGTIWKKAYLKHYRKDLNIPGECRRKPSSCHLDGDGLTSWSQWIDMAKTGTVGKRPECRKYNEKGCVENYRNPTREQRTLSFYSEELDLAAYIVVENNKGMKDRNDNSKAKLDSTSLKLTELVAAALGKELSPDKKRKEEVQLNILKTKYEAVQSN